MGQSRRKYYSVSRRVNGRVVNKYIGDNVMGRLLAAEAAQRMTALAEQISAHMRARGADLEVEKALQQLDEALKPLVNAVREAAGYHLVNGQWRKRRVFRGRTAEDPDET